MSKLDERVRDRSERSSKQAIESIVEDNREPPKPVDREKVIVVSDNMCESRYLSR